MGRKDATIEPTATNADDQLSPVEPISQETARSTTATIAAMKANREEVDDDSLPNTLTIIGHDSPSSFELTVDGEIELLDEDCIENTTVVSGSTVEGTIETGTVRFQFSGDLTDVTFVDRELTGLSPAAVPNVHVDYAAPEQSQP
ncbi:hypothetical protein [Natronorubrum halophilum]|uniref:hypothetical protein n=1 Tax=Natronorubrum halophilum TaxID=1702106 RepID=UPI0010C1901B|nr:hypothetical protein [Natronorubrum halophilum]